MREKSAQGEVVRYRRSGGMAGLDQRLTVQLDGRVVLHDRKAGTQTELTASESELANLGALVDSVPEERWHGLLGTLVQRALPRGHHAMRFQVRCGRGRIDGVAGVAEADVGGLVAQLDELLARCVREGRA